MTNSVKILLIEDHAQNLYLMKFLLEKHDYAVTCASNGPEGLALAPSVNPDVILLDIQLPGMDGHEIARTLKSDPHLKKFPIIAVTSFAMAGDREKCLAAGIEGYIEKPIDPDTFVDELKKFIADHPREIKS